MRHRLTNSRCDGLYQTRIIVQHLRPFKPDTQLLRLMPVLDIDVEQDLDVIADKADRCNDDFVASFVR